MFFLRLVVTLLVLFTCCFSCRQGDKADSPARSGSSVRIPVGMNLREVNYYSPHVPFNNLFTTASRMITYDVSGQDTSWDTAQLEMIPRDRSGMPLRLPVLVNGMPLGVRILINNRVAGEYVLLHDGEGEYTWRTLDGEWKNGRLHIKLDGRGGHVYLQISRSNEENHLRNLRLIPVEYADREDEMPLFRTAYLEGLRPFHCLRFMDWARTNNSPQVHWRDRSTPDQYSQALENGVSLEYAIALSNQVHADGWFCLPHRASDDYIRRMARLIRDTLDSSLKCYIEYSNEVWNHQFDQAHWVLHNGVSPDWQGGLREETRTVEPSLGAALQGINRLPRDQPEKNGLMMARMFRIFAAEFAGCRERLVRVAGVQHGWAANTGRILKYLFETDGTGCDAVAAGGYFSFGEKDHRHWLKTRPELISPAMVVRAARAHAAENEWEWTRATARWLRRYPVAYLVYEGGQHMQPWQQQDWPYNQAVWDAQVAPEIYDLYMENFEQHTDPRVNCRLFMAYCYLGERQSRYGSWGHLESLDQLGSASLRLTAPKYQALLDSNSEKKNL
jgi:hypothetical protein